MLIPVVWSGEVWGRREESSEERRGVTRPESGAVEGIVVTVCVARQMLMAAPLSWGTRLGQAKSWLRAEKKGWQRSEAGKTGAVGMLGTCGRVEVCCFRSMSLQSGRCHGEGGEEIRVDKCWNVWLDRERCRE